MALKDSVVIKAHTFSTIGFRATLVPNVPIKTMQTITVSTQTYQDQMVIKHFIEFRKRLPDNSKDENRPQ